MVVPRDELALLIREWYYAASEGHLEKFLSFFLPDERTTYFGTDPSELWYGFKQIRSNFEDSFKQYGKWTIMSKNLVVHEMGDIALFTDDVELSAHYGSTGIAEEARMTGALIKHDGHWKIVQAHFSLGLPNSELLPG